MQHNECNYSIPEGIIEIAIYKKQPGRYDFD